MPDQKLTARIAKLKANPVFQAMSPQKQQIAIQAIVNGQKIVPGQQYRYVASPGTTQTSGAALGAGGHPKMQFGTGAPQPQQGNISSVSRGMPAGEISRRLKVSDQAQKLLLTVDTAQNYWNNVLKPAFDRNELSNIGQESKYVWPDTFGMPDPRIEVWNNLMGLISQQANTYYSGGSGGKGGIGQFTKIVQPHVPSAPGSMGDVTGFSLFGEGHRQMNIPQQATWLPQLKSNVMTLEGMQNVPTYAKPSAPAPAQGKDAAAAVAEFGQ